MKVHFVLYLLTIKLNLDIGIVTLEILVVLYRSVAVDGSTIFIADRSLIGEGYAIGDRQCLFPSYMECIAGRYLVIPVDGIVGNVDVVAIYHATLDATLNATIIMFL